ncbi:hypothetical protein HDV57DRAFT_508543 [Trichoderma longibrachiatum]
MAESYLCLAAKSRYINAISWTYALFPISLLHTLAYDCSSPIQNMSLQSLFNEGVPAIRGLPTPASIPKEPVSLATIKYLGYTDDAAADIWRRWAARFPTGQPQELEFSLGKPFIDAIVEFSSCRYEIDTDDNDDFKWLECMDQCGINRSTQAAIMDPVYKRLRLTRSCLNWLRDTMELRYRALKEVLEARGRDHNKARGAAMAPGVSRHSAMSQAARRAVPGVVNLYKCLDAASISQLFDKNGNIDCIAALATNTPTDFCGRGLSWSFTVERDVAVLDSHWAKARSSLSSMVIVHATIPISTMQGLSEQQELQRVHWPSEEWKRLVFVSRKGLKFPPELRRFEEAPLIIGTAASKSDKAYGLMDSHDEVTEDMVLKTEDGRPVVQCVFLGDDGEDLLSDNADIQVYAVTSEEHERWRDRVAEDAWNDMAALLSGSLV